MQVRECIAHLAILVPLMGEQFDPWTLFDVAQTSIIHADPRRISVAHPSTWVAHPRRSFYTGWYEVIGTRSSYIMMSCDVHHLVMVICYQLIMVMGCDIRGRTTRVFELPMDGLRHLAYRPTLENRQKFNNSNKEKKAYKSLLKRQFWKLTTFFNFFSKITKKGGL